MAKNNGAQPQEKQYLTLDSLLGMSDLRQEDVFIKRLQKWVTIRELSAEEVFDIRRASFVKEKGQEEVFDGRKNLKGQLRAALVKPKLTPADVDALWAVPSGVVDELVQALQQMNGLSEEGEKEAENSFPAGPGEKVPVQAGG